MQGDGRPISENIRMMHFEVSSLSYNEYLIKLVMRPTNKNLKKLEHP